MTDGSRITIKTIPTVLLLFSLLISCTHLSAQLFEDAETGWEETEIVRRDHKSAATAILLSSIFPGGGHLYANHRSFGTYLFPVIEIGFWVGFFYYNNKGDDIERDYLKFADNNYKREYYYIARDNIINHEHSSSIYTTDHFRLDTDNTQHFYEDIGKYNKYIFGWTDWHETYVHPDTQEIKWRFNSEGIWLGNWDSKGNFDEPYSELRAKYISMRRDAQENYNNAYSMSFGFALNRIVSAVDAVRVTQRFNRELRYSYNFNMGLSPSYTGNITPTLNLVLSY